MPEIVSQKATDIHPGDVGALGLAGEECARPVGGMRLSASSRETAEDSLREGLLRSPSGIPLRSSISESELEMRLRARSPGFTVLRILATPYVFLITFFGFTCCLLSYCVIWPVLLGLRPPARAYVRGRVFKFWMHLSLSTLNPFWRIKVLAPPARSGAGADLDQLTHGGAIWMSNHLSGADPFVLNSVFFPRGWELKWVYKDTLHRVPLGGLCLRFSGDHPIHFTSEKSGWGTRKADVGRLMARVVHYAKNLRLSTIIFPEGTRSPTGRLLPFKLGFFKLAHQHNYPVVPVVVHNTNSLWPLGSLLCGVATAYVMLGEPMYLKDGETPELLCERVRDRMIEMLREMPLYHPKLDAPFPADWSNPEKRGRGLFG